LSNENIPVCARIFAIADSFDAMTSDRPYRSALSMPTARKVIHAERGNLFDPQTADAFLDVAEEAWQQIRTDSQDAFFNKTICGERLGLASASFPRANDWRIEMNCHAH
jgi:hypothetical protein